MKRRFCPLFLVLLTVGAAAAEERVVTLVDVPYLGDSVDDDYARTQCLLDFHYPADRKGYATIVWFHGGGLKGGSRKSGAAFAKRFTSAGYGVVLAGYRFSPRVKKPAYLEDAAAATAWTFNHVARHHGDPGKIFISGHSAGGYLTAMLGLDPRWLGKHDIAITKIAGLMPVAGQMITHSTIREERGIAAGKPLIDEFAPCHHVRRDAPPFLCLAAENDLPTRAEENIYFTAAMKAVGHKQIECRIIPGRNHGSIAGKFADPNDEVTAAMLQFMRGAE